MVTAPARSGSGTTKRTSRLTPPPRTRPLPDPSARWNHGLDRSLGPHQLDPQDPQLLVAAGCTPAWPVAAVLQHLREAGVPALGVSFGGNDARGATFPLDWGSLVPLWFLGGRMAPPVPVVLIAPARDLPAEAHVTVGAAITRECLPRPPRGVRRQRGPGACPRRRRPVRLRSGRARPRRADRRAAARGSAGGGVRPRPLAHRHGPARQLVAAPPAPGGHRRRVAAQRPRVRGADVLRDARRRLRAARVLTAVA